MTDKTNETKRTPKSEERRDGQAAGAGGCPFASARATLTPDDNDQVCVPTSVMQMECTQALFSFKKFS